MHRTPRGPFFPCLLLTTAAWILAICSASAQGTYRGYRPRDTVFRITGTNIANWSVARELKLDYTRHYQADNPDSWGALIRRATGEPYQLVESEFYRNMYNDSLTPMGRPLRLITPVEGVGLNLKMVRCFENYAKEDPVLFHNLDFKTVNSWGVFPKAMHDIAFGVTVPDGAPAGGWDTLVAEGPRYVSHYAMFEGDSAMYSRFPSLTGNFTSFRISCTFRADSLNRLIDTIAPNEVIAWFIVYRRSRQGQHDTDECRCEAFLPMDTVRITAGMYRSTPLADSAQGYKDLGKTYDFALDRVGWKYDSLVYMQSSSGDYDSLIFTKHFYERDTVAGRVYKTIATLDTISGGRRRVVRRDSIFRTLVALRYADPFDWLHGDGMEYFGARTCADPDTCANRAARGVFGPGARIINDLFESDLSVSFHSTRRVPITFLRTRVNQDLYDHLRAHRLDSAVIGASVARMEGVDTLKRILGRLAYSDETTYHKFRGDGEVARRVQEYMQAHADTTQLWCNPVANFEAFRVLTEDLDSARFRTSQLIARQDYNQIGGVLDGIPIFYLDPDRMSDFATDRTFGAMLNRGPGGTPAHVSMIVGNDDSSYQAYTLRRQLGVQDPLDPGAWICRGWGSFLSSKGPEGAFQGATVTTLARAVSAARFRYPQFGPPVQVWNSVQGMGWRATIKPELVPNDTAAIYPPWSSRPATPEEITAQGWLSLNCGVDGIVWTDAQIDENNWGYVEPVSGKPQYDYQQWRPEKKDSTASDAVKFFQPLMWTGFKSRYNAVKRMNDEIRLLDSIVHLTNLLWRQEQMSVHDQSFSTMPLVDTLLAERSTLHDTTALGVPVFNATGTYDPRNETYIELSRFEPGSRDTHGLALRSSYLMVTNRRTWPVDNRYYGTKAQLHGSGIRGLGAIDARRPVVRLKNQSEALIDSFLVEKVGHEAEWPARRVDVDSLFALDWLEPGWGAMYRISPIYSGISEHGTAWNNAVHGENPSNDLVQRDRVITYERDGKVLARAVDTAGRLAREWMISDMADTVMVPSPFGGTRPLGRNYYPAFAALRGDSASRGRSSNAFGCAIVWERRDSADNASVEMVYIDTLPTRARGLTNDTLHLQLTPPRPLLRTWMNLAPAIVAVDGDGFLVAWGSPDGDGIEVKVVQVNPAPIGGEVTLDTSRMMHAKMQAQVGGAIWPGDTIAQFPSLAYCRNLTTIITNGGAFSESAAPSGGKGGPSPLGAGDSSELHLAHLAYQQGWRDDTHWEIMYHLLGVKFRAADPPILWLSRGEHVSNNVTACNHVHPSIAVDSALVAVAWEAAYGTNSILLRFRDTLLAVESNRFRWRDPFYRWSDFNMINRNVAPGLLLRRYTHPSVTQFPGLRTAQLSGVPEGAIVWQWTNDRNGSRRNRLVLYRYGETGVDTTLRDGMDPTMILSPNLSASRSTAFTTASVFHRGKNAEAFETYFPGYLLNTPAVPNKSFSQPLAARASIMGIYEVGPVDQGISRCVSKGIRGGLGLGNGPFPPVTRRGDSTPIVRPTPNWNEWGLPPTFFPVKPDGPRPVTTLDGASGITRTGNFRAGDSAVSVRRILIGSDSLVSWLNTQPYDTAAGRPANITMMMQIVRARDSAVLWTGDTISARRLDNDTIDTVLSVPVYPYAPRDTVVYIRLYSVASPHVAYDVSAGFEFVEEVVDTSVGGTFKRVGPAASMGADNEAIAIAVVPNPVGGGVGELYVRMQSAGTATIVIYDLLGNPVVHLPDLTTDRAGEYAAPMDLGGLREGTYIVEVRMGRKRGTARFMVVQ